MAEESKGRFEQVSYDMHREQFSRVDEERLKLWLREDTVDHWRHQRQYLTAEPLLRAWPASSWVTVGDGRLGLDAIRLHRIAPRISVLPTDISPYLLERSKAMGLISDFRAENAEKLSFSDESFDVALCKDAYHHFPRPAVALYEMLRVARKAVVLIEPMDPFPMGLTRKVVAAIRKWPGQFRNRKVLHPEAERFEDSGNYFYGLTPRELEKAAIGLQLPLLALRYFNDCYEAGVEEEPAVQSSKLFRKVKRRIRRRDFKCKMGWTHYDYLTAVIFKTMPDAGLAAEMARSGFEMHELPANPYLK